MSRETKSNGQKDIYDRFYTQDDIVNKCLDRLDLEVFDCIIEPSAGSGSFSSKLLNCFAYDIAPAADNIEQADWFSVSKAQFKDYKNILVVGNPPFGQQNTLAIRFFNESAKFCNTIAFILPRSFKKTSIQNQLDLSFHLVDELDLVDCSFILNNELIKVPCVFQIWEKQEAKRKKIKLNTTTKFFNFVTKEEADFRIQRVGGNAGKASFELDYAASSNYFIKNQSELSNKELVDIINTLIFPSIEYTVGPKSLSKGELIMVLEDFLENETEKSIGTSY